MLLVTGIDGIKNRTVLIVTKVNNYGIVENGEYILLEDENIGDTSIPPVPILTLQVD